VTAVVDSAKLARFEQAVLTHFDAAYNLARWLTRSSDDADDVVQEACLRAFTFFDSFQGGMDGRAWLLSIVRNTCYTWLKKKHAWEGVTEFDENRHTPVADSANAEAIQMRRADWEMVKQAIEKLPPEYREVLILREMEGLSYKEVAGITGLPIGTVMSRLSRARQRLHDLLSVPIERESLR
jgi:RNA polymerase sigma-70 factor (ECF subfamily)